MSLRDSIKSQEGLRLSKYLDIAGYWTIGYGHRCPSDQPDITKEQAEVLFEGDLSLVIRNVLVLSPTLQGRRLDAIVDLCFNAGVGAYAKSQLRQEVNRHDWITAAANLRTWDHVHKDGHVIESADLKARRAQDAIWLQNG